MPSIMTPDQVKLCQIETLRRNIDDCDERIVANLYERKRSSDIIQELKKQMGNSPQDPKREADIFRRVPHWMHPIFEAILLVSRGPV